MFDGGIIFLRHLMHIGMVFYTSKQASKKTGGFSEKGRLFGKMAAFAFRGRDNFPEFLELRSSHLLHVSNPAITDARPF